MRTARKIYLVDDDEDDRMLFKDALERIIEGVNICEFEGAFAFYEQVPVLPLKSEDSLILLDMNMPKMDGLELLRELRSGQSYAHIPVIIISTTINQMIVHETRALGVELYLCKPNSHQELTTIAQTIFSCYQQHFGH